MEVLGPLSLSEAKRATERPGLYVWYARLVLGLADLASTEMFESQLIAFTERLDVRRMSVYATSNFNLRWKGTLESRNRISDGLEKVTSRLETQRSRELARQILLASQRHFFQPLYIGQAESLRVRLSQHVAEFHRLRALQEDTGETADCEDHFAHRAAKLGLTDDELICYAMPVTADPNTSLDERMAAISVAEFCLNSWAFPSLGRR